MSEKSAKSHLRHELRQRLSARSPDQRSAASREIGEHLTGSKLWLSVHRVYAFAPLASEPDLTRWDWRGKSLALPRVTAEGLEFYTVAGFGELEIHRMGMAEPPMNAERAGPPDLVLVPGLGFDRKGGRLGRGGGFYDRFLATLPASLPCFGIGFECQICAAIPLEPHDVQLAGVITERGTWLSAASPDSPEAFAVPDHSPRASGPESQSPPDKI